MPALVSLVEGDGDKDAVPTLLTKILHDLEEWNWYVGEIIVVRSLGKLNKYLTRYMEHAMSKNNCGAILIVLDLDDGCPVDSAYELAAKIAPLNLAQPVAIVFASREYEAWFLASLPTLAGHHDLPKDVAYEGDVEERRDVKAWLKRQMKQGIGYNPVVHQKKFTSLIDLELAYENSRSFRRLYHAIEQLLETAERGGRGYVSPLVEEEGEAMEDKGLKRNNSPKNNSTISWNMG